MTLPPSGSRPSPRPASARGAAPGRICIGGCCPGSTRAPHLSATIRTALRTAAPYPGDDDLPFGADFAQTLTLSMPRSDEASSTWWFDELPHTVVTVQGLRRAPDIGHMTAERPSGDHVFSLFDRLPEHTVMVLTITVKPQDLTRNHIGLVKRAAVGDSAEAALTREDAAAVEREMATGNKLYPFSMAFYVRGQDLVSLRANVNQLNALLLPNALQPITREADLLALDSYLRNLPMAYDARLDRLSRRSRLVFSRHIANLLPLYGRSRGTGHPGLVFFNRGAEPLVFDPLHRSDRKKNAHMLILGPDRCRQVRVAGLSAPANGGRAPAADLHHRGRRFVLATGSALCEPRPRRQPGHPQPRHGRQPATVCRCAAPARQGPARRSS